MNINICVARSGAHSSAWRIWKPCPAAESSAALQLPEVSPWLHAACRHATFGRRQQTFSILPCYMTVPCKRKTMRWGILQYMNMQTGRHGIWDSCCRGAECKQWQVSCAHCSTGSPSSSATASSSASSGMSSPGISSCGHPPLQLLLER